MLRCKLLSASTAPAAGFYVVAVSAAQTVLTKARPIQRLV
jgi:hypothetical protein